MLKLSFNNSLTSWLDLISDIDISICKNLYVYSLVLVFGSGKCFFTPTTFLFRPSWLSLYTHVYVWATFWLFLLYDIFILFADKKKIYLIVLISYI